MNLLLILFVRITFYVFLSMSFKLDVIQKKQVKKKKITQTAQINDIFEFCRYVEFGNRFDSHFKSFFFFYYICHQMEFHYLPVICKILIIDNACVVKQ